MRLYYAVVLVVVVWGMTTVAYEAADMAFERRMKESCLVLKERVYPIPAEALLK